MEKEIKLVLYDPMVLVKCMDEYFKTKTPDCSLYSEDGYEIPVHCEVLYQTKWVVYFGVEQFDFYFIIDFFLSLLLPLTQRNMRNSTLPYPIKM